MVAIGSIPAAGGALAAGLPAASSGAVTLAISYSPGAGAILDGATTSSASFTGTFAGVFADPGDGAHFEGTATLTGVGGASGSWSQGFDEYVVQMAGRAMDGSSISCAATDDPTFDPTQALVLQVDRLPAGIAVAVLQGPCLIGGTPSSIDTVIVGTWVPANPGGGLSAPETSVVVAGTAGGS
jgi:hypothetical protein